MKNCFLRKLSSTKRAGSRPVPIGSNENNIASSRACGPTAAICLCRRRPPFLEKSLISYNLALCNFLGPELFAGSDGKHEIHKHVLLFSLFCFLSEARPGGKRGGVRKSKDTKNLPSRKNATRRAHKQNICRCAGAPSAQGHGCCIFHNLSQKQCFAFFAAKPQSSKINAFQQVRRIGNVLAAFCGRAGCALAALWGRSAAHTRPSQRPELAFRPGPLALRLLRSLPTGCRCGDLAPGRAAGPASKQAARRQSFLGKTKSYTS